MANDQNEEINELPAESLEELGQPGAAPPPPPAAGGARGFPQLHRFMWGGIIVLAGSLLPLGGAVVESMRGEQAAAPTTAADDKASRKDALKELANNLGGEAGKVQPAAAEAVESLMTPAPVPMYETFTGALFLIFSLMLIGQMRSAIAERRVALGAVLLMFFPAGWAWFKLVALCGDLAWFSAGDLYRLATWEQLTGVFGSGFMLVLLGSTYVVINFFRALFGAATGGKKPVPAAAPARSGRSRRR